MFEMRRWNEALVTNMLPEHVAKHFLGSKKRDEVWMSGFQVLVLFVGVRKHLYKKEKEVSCYDAFHSKSHFSLVLHWLSDLKQLDISLK